MSIKQAIEALSVAIKQNEHDMLMTGDELRQCSAALAALRAMPAEPVALCLPQLTAPRKIWLNLFGDFSECEQFPDDHEGVTWSDDEAGDFNVPYVRADLATPHTAPVPAEPTADVPETDCGNMQPTPMRNFAAAINNLITAVSAAVLGAPLREMPTEPVDAAAWMRHDDPRQVISGLEKRDAVAAGGAFAASVVRYDIPLVHQHEAAPHTAPDCAGGMPCTNCPNKRKCQAGCIRQGEALERPNQNDATQRHPLDVEALHELQKVVADFGGDWPDVPGEQEVVRRAKMLSRLWKTDRASKGTPT